MTGSHQGAGSADTVADRFGERIADGLRHVSTATLTSQLRKRALDGCMFSNLRLLGRADRMVGFARTVRYLPLREDLFPARSAGFNAQKQAVEALRPGDVLVISARGVHDAGTIGDILAMRAADLGAAGIVTDGSVRDVVAIDSLDIPTYAAGHHPAPLGHRHVPWDTDVAVACAGVLVEPGDLLVGDTDGVVLLPDGLAAEIVEDAIEQEREERFIAEQVRAGSSVDGLYPLNSEWRARYEASREKDPT